METKRKYIPANKETYLHVNFMKLLSYNPNQMKFVAKVKLLIELHMHVFALCFGTNFQELVIKKYTEQRNHTRPKICNIII